MSDPKEPKPRSYNYRDAGVDIDAGDALVERIKPAAASTRRSGAGADLGGFGGLFDLKAAGYSDPLLVAATDGVGTKLKIAIEADVHDTVGIDLVAMCVNDLVVQGAEPLFFLDYYASGKLDVATAANVVEGIADGCRQAGCALIGGETAEMPGMYASTDYDLAGFAVGAVEREALLDGKGIAAGDVVLGLASSGIHSNGYSLVRKLVSDLALDWAGPAPFDTQQNLARALLTPTRIYVKPLLAALKAGGVHGLVHITGGGFPGNIPRVLPDDLAAEIDAESWSLPPVFQWLQETGSITPDQMARTFNCGIGMVMIVDAPAAAGLTQLLADAGETVYQIGRIIRRTDTACRLVGGSGLWGAPSAWTCEAEG